MPIYIYITYLAILCFPDMIFSSSPKSHDKSHSPPHHVCCSRPPRQIPNVHYLGGLGNAKSSGRWCHRCPSAAEVSNSSGWQWPSAAVWPKCNPGKKTARRMPQDKNGTGTKNCRYMLSSYLCIHTYMYVTKTTPQKTDTSTSSATIQPKNCLRMRRRARSSR